MEHDNTDIKYRANGETVSIISARSEGIKYVYLKMKEVNLHMHLTFTNDKSQPDQ